MEGRQISTFSEYINGLTQSPFLKGTVALVAAPRRILVRVFNYTPQMYHRCVLFLGFGGIFLVVLCFRPTELEEEELVFRSHFSLPYGVSQ